MKIGFMVRDISSCGGIQQITCTLLNSFVKSGFCCDVISLYHKNDTNFFILNEKIERIVLFERVPNFSEDFFLIRKKINNVICNKRYDVLVVQDVFFSIFFSYSTWKDNRIIICEHICCNCGRIGDKHWIGKKLALRLASRIICITKSDWCEYKKHEIRKTVIEWIPNPYSEFIEEIPYDINNKVIISCGRFSYEKGFEKAIQVASKVLRKHPDWTWAIYGDGNEKENLQYLIKYYGLTGRVVLKGFVSDKNVIYQDKGIFVLTSSHEGFGLVLIEAMRYGIPVVSFDIKEGPRELIKNGYNGYLIPYDNIDKMAEKIDFLINNMEVRTIISENEKEYAKRYSPDNVVKKWEKLFYTLIYERKE